MINNKELSQALSIKLNQVCIDYGYTLVLEDEEYSPGADETYIEEHLFFGKENQIGYTTAAGSVQRGIYEITVLTPKAVKNSRIAGLNIVNNLLLHFGFGAKLSKGYTTLQITGSDTTKPNLSKTHITHVVSVAYVVVN